MQQKVFQLASPSYKYDTGDEAIKSFHARERPLKLVSRERPGEPDYED